VLCVLVTATASLREGGSLAADLCTAHPEVVGVVQNENPSTGNVLLGERDRVLSGSAALEDRIGSIVLELSARAFFQINRRQTARIYEAVAQACALSGGETVADIYSGVGGIALTLASSTRRVVAIEENPAATADAERSIARAGARNIEVITSAAGPALAAQKDLDCIVLNPPRRGCEPRALQGAAHSAPRRIVYVSCNPKSLARDLQALAELGYRASRATPFDMLPHTPHVEVLVTLERSRT
jgi:23S rRNA (uracil1939-C5)-methyltransferase